MNIENLRHLVYGRELNIYQKADAIAEFEKLEKKLKEKQDIKKILRDFAKYAIDFESFDIEITPTKLVNDYIKTIQ